MKNILTLLIAIVSLAISPFASAQAPSAQDFLPPAAGGTTEVSQPNNVKIVKEKNTIFADTMQDAANAAVKYTANANEGFVFLSVPSGTGALATGVAQYRVMANPNANIISKRQAYIVAYHFAKVNLAKGLNESQNDGTNLITQAAEYLETQDSSKASQELSTEERVSQTVNALIRGYVIYEVKEDPASNFITVSIITTPKTSNGNAHISTDTLDAQTIAKGIEQVLSEVKSGVVPPVGGRVISCKETGELAYVGFGSSVIRSIPSPAMQAQAKLTALRIAETRARDSLCGIIRGDNVAAQHSVNGNSQDSSLSEVAYKLEKKDPLSDDKGAKRSQEIKQQKEEFFSPEKNADVISSARKGIIPPGVMVQKWADENGEWAIAMAVYMPSVTEAAVELNEKMRNGKIVIPYGQGSASGSSVPAKDPSSLKSGKVHNDADL